MTHLPLSMMTELQNKQIVVLGLGITGLSCVRFLTAHNIACAVNDSRVAPLDVDTFKQQYSDVNISLGEWDSELISKADLLLVSPGIDLAQTEIANAINDNCLVWGDVELFCRVNNATKQYSMLAVTGSNGKSTVVSLLAHLGDKLGLNVQLGGNIGQPVLDLLNPKCQQSRSALDMLIVELSSFQLETLKSMQAIAATVLNVSDDHLDRHRTLESYQAIKQSIYQQGGIAVINRDDTRTNNLSGEQKIISFGSDKPTEGQFGLDASVVSSTETTAANEVMQLMFGDQALLALEELPLAGVHNGLNYLAALALGYSAGWPLTDMVNNLASFTGLAHRCQRVASNDDVFWINDSKATNVGATIAAISGLASTMPAAQKLILIAGGEGKGADFSPLQHELKQHVSYLITLGKDGEKIAQLVNQQNHQHVCTVNSMEQAVAVARKLANAGDTVMLSPACASFDMFNGFADRGNAFIAAVQSYSEKTMRRQVND